MKWKKTIAVIMGLILMAFSVPVYAGSTDAKESDFTDVAILSTTDMHGKCWDTNVLNGRPETNNMLRVSTAVDEFRDKYGKENVILVDNGDLYQGTPVSEIQLLRYAAGESTEPLAMSVCLKEIGYDAFVLGNHEFNYSWKTMSDTYRYLQENGIPVVAANICYEGTLEGTRAGDNVFEPYIVKTITVNGHEHKIGILGLENSDITRWDLPVRYPGMQFAHPGNENYSMTREVEFFLPKMKEEGCEFIIVSYHGGIGDTDGDLRFGFNTVDQGLRLIEESEDIDLLINGHDHTSEYSNKSYANRKGREIMVVNGGGQELTHSIFRFSEDPDGKLVWKVMESENLRLGPYKIDESLKALIKPYADMAEVAVEQPVGRADGDWDKSSDYYTRQTDSMDLVSAVMIECATKELEKKTDEEKKALGLDHLDVDMAMTNVSVNGGYVVAPGEISMKDIYSLYGFTNALLVLPMRGSEIKAVMEENAEKRLAARIHQGKVYYYDINDPFSNLLFGGINFVYDMSRPEGDRVLIENFSNGRPFEEDGLYLVAVNDFILGSERCGLRDFGTKDAIWSQFESESGESIQELIAEYIRDHTEAEGAIRPDAFNWHWEMTWSSDPAAAPAYEGKAGAAFVDAPEDGHQYILCNEPVCAAVTGNVDGGGMDGVQCQAVGEILAAPLPEEAKVFTAHLDEKGTLQLTDPEGRFLASGKRGGLLLADKGDDSGLTSWRLEPCNGGYIVSNEGTNEPRALEYYSGRFSTYAPGKYGRFVYNFYEVK